MKIAQSGDWHLTDDHRFDDTLGTLEWVSKDAIEQGADVFLFGGDASGHDAPHAMTKREENALADIIMDIAEHMEVVWLMGNHDREEDLEPFRKLRTKHEVHVVTRPRIVEVDHVAAVFCLPYPSKRWAVGSGALGGSIAEQKQAIEATIRQLLEHWKIEAVARRMWSVGLFHCNIAGSIVGGGEQHIGREIELAAHDLIELGFDVGFLSHIHKPQAMAPGWRYAGSPAMQNHGESSDEKSYVLCELAPGHEAVWTLRPTPTRKLVTVNAEWGIDPERGTWGWVGEDLPRAGVLEGAEVRLRYYVPAEAVDMVAPAVEQLATLIRGDGAHLVKLERKVKPTTSAGDNARAAAIAGTTTMAEKLAAWCAVEGIADKQRARLLEKLAHLEA